MYWFYPLIIRVYFSLIVFSVVWWIDWSGKFFFIGLRSDNFFWKLDFWSLFSDFRIFLSSLICHWHFIGSKPSYPRHFIRILSTAMAFCHKRLPRFFSPWIQLYFQTHIFKDHKTSFCVDDIPQKHHLIVSNLFNFQLCNLYAVGFPAISVSKFYY